MANILAVGAHPDDIELGAGGTVASLIKKGDSVTICDLTNGEPTPYGSPEVRAKETMESNAILKVERRINLGLQNRWMKDSDEARVKLAEVYREIRPDVILAPYHLDAHPDHVAASSLAQSARFIAKYTKTDMKGEPFYPPRIFFYLCIHLKKMIEPTLIFDISETIEQKLEAVKVYRSQFYSGDKPRGDEIINRLRAQAAYFGYLAGVGFGEPFVKLEEIGVRSFDHLIP
ncbi:MAG: bacillithiol biosynthesis deacetylase BshB1 [Nitrospinota bacterium]|nr:bacillithiol biosynthesis deacetylase BshB1 [Nitrospinota bacterium]